MVLQGVPPELPSAIKVNVSTNIQWMGAIQFIVFERLATIRRVVHAARICCARVELLAELLVKYAKDFIVFRLASIESTFPSMTFAT
jgi:hypothetical protein